MSNLSRPSGTSTFRNCRPCHTSWRHLAAGAFALLIGAIVGCQGGGFDKSLDSAVKTIFTGQRSPQQYMLVAVSSEDPDARRDAVARVSKSKEYDREWAVKGFVAIALLESDAQTRCVAIRALGRTSDPRAAETMLKILNYRDYRPEEVWPPTAIVRWDATQVLASLSERDAIPEEMRDAVCETLLDRLRLDADRHARLAAARGLGHYPRLEAVEALIAGLEDEDFAVVHECEVALVKLTGYTHDGNALAWQDWLDEHRDAPFAKRGHVPESRQPPYTNRWEKVSYRTKDLLKFLWPGRDDD